MDSDLFQEIELALDKGEKLKAVKLFVDSTGSDLKTAKDFIDNFIESNDNLKTKYSSKPTSKLSDSKHYIDDSDKDFHLRKVDELLENLKDSKAFNYYLQNINNNKAEAEMYIKKTSDSIKMRNSHVRSYGSKISTPKSKKLTLGKIMIYFVITVVIMQLISYFFNLII